MKQRPVVRLGALLVGVVVLAAACGSSGDDADAGTADSTVAPAPDAAASGSGGGTADGGGDGPAEPIVIQPGVAREFPPPPPVPDGPLDAETIATLDDFFGNLDAEIDAGTIRSLGDSGDPRVGWLIADLLRFLRGGGTGQAAMDAFNAVAGTDIAGAGDWGAVTDHLIAWDIPAPPGYVGWKRQLFELVEPGWAPFFDDADADIDWRIVSWGGVLIDDRPLDEVALPCPEGCIPALNDPAVVSGPDGDWYPDDAIVFGIVVDGEARAYPKNIMEVHEMVNDDIGGRRIGMPYCTLCGSAQAYFIDEPVRGLSADIDATGAYELRTSGLLSRSNKVMYEFHTRSVFDTFTGDAVTGPLRAEGVTLEQLTVVTSTWGDWKAAHPDTTIVAQDGGIGRSYPDDPLRGRDDDGPIFPIGDVDPRLPVQESVVGVALPDGATIAFPAAAARTALARGEVVELDGVSLLQDAGGFRAVGPDGTEIATHQAFWFAWSQFHPTTALWNGG